MANLLKYQAKLCYTAAGILIYQQKVLLVKHKKVGFWLNPGGHCEANEAPHQTAEREFWEETGIKVRAKEFGLMGSDGATALPLPVESDIETQYLPSPMGTNLHWVCQDNYEHRVHGKSLTEYARKFWAKGCEQHLNFVYLVEPVATTASQSSTGKQHELTLAENREETDGIAWYSQDELKKLDTPQQIKNEVLYAFSLS